MDQRDISYFHKLWLTWGEWELAERSVQGLFPETWPDTTTKQSTEHRTGPCKPRRGDKLLTPMPVPLSTRERPSSRPLTARLDSISPKIRSLAIVQPDDIKRVIICLWLRRDSFQNTSNLLDMSSRRIGQIKYGLLKQTQGIV